MSKPLLTGTAREHITRMWPKHLAHLAPEGNKMGQGTIDPEEGVVCNCGEVLGFPAVQDEADYVAAEPDRPDTSGVQTGDPDDEPDDDALTRQGAVSTFVRAQDEPDWTPQLTEREHAPDPDQPPFVDCPTGCELNPEPHTRSWHDNYVHGRTDLTAPDPGPPWDETPQQDYEPSWIARGQDADPESPAEPKGVMPYRDPGVVEAQDPLAARVVVIDPSLPYGPREVEEQLLDIEARLERGMHYQRYWEEREFAAESAWTASSARARLEDTSGAKDIRDARVQVACQAQWDELLLCRTMVKSMRETMHTLRSLQSGYQTVSRSVSESMRLPARSRT